MKKLIGILILLCVGVISMAQTTVPFTVNVDNYAAVDNSDRFMSGAEGDSIINYEVNFQTPTPYLYDYAVKLDSMGTGAAATISLYGKLWDSDSYTIIGSAIEWAGTSADTTIKFSEHSTKQYNQNIKVVVVGDSCTVDYFKGRIWK